MAAEASRAWGGPLAQEPLLHAMDRDDEKKVYQTRRSGFTSGFFVCFLLVCIAAVTTHNPGNLNAVPQRTRPESRNCAGLSPQSSNGRINTEVSQHCLGGRGLRAFSSILSSIGHLRGGANEEDMMQGYQSQLQDISKRGDGLEGGDKRKSARVLTYDEAKRLLEAHINMQATSQIAACMQEFLAPDTQRLQAAETFAKEAFKEAQSVMSLLYIMTSLENTNAQVRQIAGTFFRKTMAAHWPRIAEAKGPEKVEIVEIFKTLLLGLLTREPYSLSRRATAASVAMLNKRVHWRQNWQQLEDFVFAGMASGAAETREVSMVLLYFMSDEVGLWLMDGDAYAEKLARVYEAGLKDSDKRVSIAALRAFASLAGKVGGDEEILHFERLIPLMLNALSFAVKQGQEDIVVEVLEILDELAPSKTRILDAQLESMLTVCLEILSFEGISGDLADGTLSLLASLVKYKSKQLQKLPRIQEVLSIAFKLIAQQVTEREDAENGSAADLLSEMAIQFPNDYIFEPTANLIMQMLQSPEPHVRGAGVLALGAIADGCADSLRPHIDSLLTQVTKVLQDPDIRVKRYGLVTLSRFADDLGEAFLAEKMANIAQDLLPLLKSGPDSIVSAAAQVMQRMSCNAERDVLKPLLEPMLLQFVDILKTRLMMMSQLSGTATETNTGDVANTDDSDIKTTATADVVSAIGAMAEGSQADFTPFVPGVMEILTSLWGTPSSSDPAAAASSSASKSASENLIKGRTMEAAGTIAKAVGRSVFNPYIEHSVRTATGVVSTPGLMPEVTSNALYMLTGIVNVLQADIGPSVDGYLSPLVKLLKETKSTTRRIKSDPSLPSGPALNLNLPSTHLDNMIGGYSDEETDEDDDEKDDKHFDDDEDEHQEDDSDDYMDQEPGTRHVRDVRTAECMKLSAAYELIRSTASSSPMGLEPFIKEIWQILSQEHIDNYDHTVRMAAIESIPSIMEAALSLADFYQKQNNKRDSGKWVAWVQEVIDEIGQELQWVITNESVMKVVETAVSAYQRLLEVCAESSFKQKVLPKSMMDDVHKLVKRILKGKTAAQGFEPPSPTWDGTPTAGSMPIMDQEETKAEDHGGKEYCEGRLDEVELLEVTVELMAAVARRKGVKFERKFKRLAPMLQHLLVEGDTAEARSQGASGFAEACLALGPAAQPYVETLRPILVRVLEGLQDKERAQKMIGSGERRLEWSSIWCIGVLCSVAPRDLRADYPKFLSLFLPSLRRKEAGRDSEMVQDNAVFTLARMIRSNPDNVAIDEVLPAMLAALPLKHDNSEIGTLTDFFVYLWKRRHEAFITPQVLAQVLGAVGHILATDWMSESLEDPARDAVLVMCREILQHAQASGNGQMIWNAIPAPDREALEKALDGVHGGAGGSAGPQQAA